MLGVVGSCVRLHAALPTLFQYVLLLLFCLAVVYASVCRPNLIRLVIPPPRLFSFPLPRLHPRQSLC